ncbi:MAG: hypothetical protein ACFB0C_11875 [Leptolyngbyaceae cyanobacterium]
MDTDDLKQPIARYGNRPLEQRKQWYSPAAVAYDAARPKYPAVLTNQVVTQARLSAQSKVLEVGCGPGTATVPLAALGLSILSDGPRHH